VSDELSSYMASPSTLPYEMPTTWCAVVFGPKGAGKSTTAFGINKANYKTAVIDFDGNSAQTIKSNISPAKQSNFKVWNVKALVNFKDLEGSQILTESEKVVDILEGQIYDEVAEYQPDIIVADGYQRFVWLAEMSMRSTQRKRDLKNNVERVTGAFTGVANRGAWKERNWTLDRFYESCVQASKVGFIVTSHERERPRSDDQQFAGFEPSWAGALKEESQLVIRQYMTVAGQQNLRWNQVESNKLTGHEPVDFDITGEPYKLWEWLFDKEPQYLL